MLSFHANAKGGVMRQLEPVIVDPTSNWPLLAEKTKQLLTQDKVAVIFGCWTSVSRKSVLPVVEELNGLLFYPVQYEGEDHRPQRCGQDHDHGHRHRQDPADAGTVFFGSTIDLLRHTEPQIAQLGIGRKFQKPTVFEQLTVFQNLELALKTGRRAEREVWASMFFSSTQRRATAWPRCCTPSI